MLEKVKNGFVENRDKIVKVALGIGATLLGMLVVGKVMENADFDDESDDFIELDETDIEIEDVEE